MQREKEEDRLSVAVSVDDEIRRRESVESPYISHVCKCKQRECVSTMTQAVLRRRRHTPRVLSRRFDDLTQCMVMMIMAMVMIWTVVATIVSIKDSNDTKQRSVHSSRGVLAFSWVYLRQKPADSDQKSLTKGFYYYCSSRSPRGLR